ncbi:MAG: hypothetical protein ABJO43_12640, partial [Marinobacter sp.]|uniref:hypothetical protein n=1 Tax=Marinobacter sp. TaxID=50741 RepID=UPI00329764A2
MGAFFLLEKELASLRHLFPCQKKYPHPPIDVQHRDTQVEEAANLPWSARRGVVSGFFARKRCLSEASSFSKKIQMPPRKPARKTARPRERGLPP